MNVSKLNPEFVVEKFEILEIGSDQVSKYKDFLSIGLVNDEDSFRITPGDDLKDSFPTKDTKDSFTLGAYFDNRLAGVVSFIREGIDREKLRHKGVMFRLYVSKSFRGNGIAEKLIKELLNRAKQLQDIEQINLTVVASNVTAKRLYKKFGFKTFGLEQNAIKWKGKYFAEEQMVLKFDQRKITNPNIQGSD